MSKFCKRVVVLSSLVLQLPLSAYSQIQLEWIAERPYNIFSSGTVRNSTIDGIGGIFISAASLDTMCYYSMSELYHINTTGNVSWIEPLFYETPCLQQGSNWMSGRNGTTYSCITDTAGHIVKIDSTGIIRWIANYPGYYISTLSVEMNQGIYAVRDSTLTSKIIQIDSAGMLNWVSNNTYSFTHEYKKVLSDSKNRPVCIMDFDDQTQAEAFGVGIVKLDTLGVLLWDTMVNSQVSPDPDVFIDAQLDEQDNLFVLSKDNSISGAFLHLIDSSGNITAFAQFNMSSGFIARGLELDSIHDILYLYGRTNSDLIVTAYNYSLDPIDTIVFNTVFPGLQALGVNEYGYMFHLWVCDSGAVNEMRLDMFNHLGQQVDGYSYWDTTRFNQLYPRKVLFDRLGGIFIICDAARIDGADAGVVIKISTPMDMSDELLFGENVIVYPNPATNSFFISVPGESLTTFCNIYSSEGKLLLCDRFTGELRELNTDSMNPGIYLVEVILENGQRSTHKLIIQQQ